MTLDYPLRDRPAAVQPVLSRDPHNSYLNAFMSGGWIGGFSYLDPYRDDAGDRPALRVRDTRRGSSTYIAVYAAFAATAAESAIIDSCAHSPVLTIS